MSGPGRLPKGRMISPSGAASSNYKPLQPVENTSVAASSMDPAPAPGNSPHTSTTAICSLQSFLPWENPPPVSPTEVADEEDEVYSPTSVYLTPACLARPSRSRSRISAPTLYSVAPSEFSPISSIASSHCVQYIRRVRPSRSESQRAQDVADYRELCREMVYHGYDLSNHLNIRWEAYLAREYDVRWQERGPLPFLSRGT